MSDTGNRQPTAAPPVQGPAAGPLPAPAPTPGYGPPPNPAAYPGGPYHLQAYHLQAYHLQAYPLQTYPLQPFHYPQYQGQPPMGGMPQAFTMPPLQQGPYQMPPGTQPFPPGPHPGFAPGPQHGQPEIKVPQKEAPPPMLPNEPFANFVNHMSQLLLESGADDTGFRKSCSILMQLDMENHRHESRKLQRRGFALFLERGERQLEVMRTIRKQFVAEYAKIDPAAAHRVRAIAQMHMNAVQGEWGYVVADLIRLKHAEEQERTLFDARDTVERMKATEHPFLFSETTVDTIAPFLHTAHSAKISIAGSPRYTKSRSMSRSKSSSKVSSEANPNPTPPKSDGPGPTGTAHEVVPENTFQLSASRAWELFGELMSDLESPDWRGAGGNPADTVFAELAAHIVAADQHRKLRGRSLRKVLVEKLNDDRRRARGEARARRHGGTRDEYDSDQMLSPRPKSPRSPRTPLLPRAHRLKSPYGSHRSHHTKQAVSIVIKDESELSSAGNHKFTFTDTPPTPEYQHKSKLSSHLHAPALSEYQGDRPKQSSYLKTPAASDRGKSRPSSHGNTPAPSEHHMSKDNTRSPSEHSKSNLSVYAKFPASVPSEYLYGTSEYSLPPASGDGCEAFPPVPSIPHGYAKGSEQERLALVLGARVQSRRLLSPSTDDAQHCAASASTVVDDFSRFDSIKRPRTV